MSNPAYSSGHQSGNTAQSPLDLTGEMCAAIYDYSKYMHSTIEDRHNQMVKRATDITGFTGLTSALIANLLRDGSFGKLNSLTLQNVVLLASVSFFLVSLLSAIIVLRIKRTTNMACIGDVKNDVIKGMIGSTAALRIALSQNIGDRTSDMESVIRSDAIVLFVSHIFLVCGVVLLIVWLGSMIL
jgi:hypothetical protein